jgi:4-amino-4-deoxy-L-arabinose transferase-like glycosyltransferase
MEGVESERTLAFPAIWAILVVTVLVGATMRFHRLGSLPFGIYHDEAINGQDALGILEGRLALFFEANNGREPLFLYGMAAALAALGRTPFAVRVTAAVLGTLIIPATFLLGHALFNDRVGLWSAALIAVAPWPINLSRIGLRAVSMPLVTSLGLYLWWTGRRARQHRMVFHVLSGTMLGLSLYTYTAARLVIVALVVFALYQAWVSQEPSTRSEWTYLFLAVALATVPLAIYGATHWSVFAERSTQVSIFNPAINDGRPLRMLIRNVFRAAGLFTFVGDSIPRHNVPLRPLFDPLVSLFFAMGVLLSLVQARSSTGHAISLIWTGVMLVPTILAEDCPHFLRAVGVLPIAVLFPAIGLEWTRNWLHRRNRSRLGAALVGTVLVVSAIWGGYDYFVRHAHSTDDPGLAYAFEGAQLIEAIEINRFLGTGWQGTGVREPDPSPISGRHVYLAPRMWEDRHTVNLLIASPQRISILDRDPPVKADQVLALVWPYGDVNSVRQVLPTPATITVTRGPLERGDLDPEPRLLYVAFRADRQIDTHAVAAQFEQGIELLDWTVGSTPENGTRLDLHWRVKQPLSIDYTVFVHLERDGTIVAQQDGTPGRGYYPTSWWRPGDQIVDTHYLDTSWTDTDRLWVGWYQLGSMQHLRVLDRNSQPGLDRLLLE